MLKRFLTNQRGAAALELAIISPVFLLGSVVSVDLGLRYTSRQSAGSAVSHGAELLQDFMVEHTLAELSRMDPDSDAHPYRRAALAVNDALGPDAATSNVTITTWCGCPGLDSATPESVSEAADPAPFYAETEGVLTGSGAPICPSRCADGQSRVSVEITVDGTTRTLGAGAAPFRETLRARIR